MQSIRFSIPWLLRWKALACEQVPDIHGIAVHQIIDSDCEVHLSVPRHGGKSNRYGRGSVSKRRVGTKALHSSASIRESKGSIILTEQSNATKQSPLYLLRAVDFRPCPLAELLFLHVQEQGRKRLVYLSQEGSFQKQVGIA